MLMTNQDAIQMMRRASQEIRDLRRTIDTLAPKADAYDTIRRLSVSIAGPEPSRGYGEDLVWRLDKEAAALEAELAAERVPPAASTLPTDNQ